MKVVINRCYGGFGISKKALLELIKKDSDVVSKISIEEYTGGREKTLQEMIEADKWLKYTEYRDGFFQNDLGERLYKDDVAYFIDDVKEVRTHPDLVEVVEKMGVESFARFAHLEIVEIPNGVEWEIEEYDGMEWVSEKHRRWS